MSTRKDEMDSFWNLEQLIPVKKNRLPSSAPVNLPLIQSAPEPASSCPETIPAVHTELQQAECGKPESVVWQSPSPLFKRITVQKWKSSFNYYEDFYTDALRLANRKGVPVSPAPFFSYVPQYSQLTISQYNWYIYWRTQLQDNHTALPTDKSYVMLYLYEIINLADKIDPHLGLQRLLFVWNAYKDSYPGINKYLSEWIIDYCLIHHLTPAASDTAFLTADMTSSCTLKEFYWHFDPKDLSGFASFLLRHASSYQYVQSKYYKDETRELYDRHIPAAVSVMLADTTLMGKIKECLNVHTAKVIRDAYVGALCACLNKRKLEIEYLSFSRSHEVRYLIGDAVKYAENHIRAYLGIKSRLSIYSLPDSVRLLIDDYFDQHLPHDCKKTTVQREEYEKYYDVPEKELSVDDAKNIEQTSWDTTDKLIASMQTTEEEPIEQEDSSTSAPGNLLSLPLSDSNTDSCKKCENPIVLHKEFVLFMISGDLDNALLYCRNRQLLFDSVINVINENAVNLFGDVLFENGEIIEEYKREILNYYNSTLK